MTPIIYSGSSIYPFICSYKVWLYFAIFRMAEWWPPKFTQEVSFMYHFILSFLGTILQIFGQLSKISAECQQWWHQKFIQYAEFDISYDPIFQLIRSPDFLEFLNQLGKVFTESNNFRKKKIITVNRNCPRIGNGWTPNTYWLIKNL